MRQSPEETVFAERIAAILVPLHMARHNRKWDSAHSALMAIPGANVNDVDLCKNRTFCCGSGGRCFWKEGEGHNAHQSHALDQIAVANPETLAVGCPFCMTMMEDAIKSRLLEDKICICDLSGLIAESTTLE